MKKTLTLLMLLCMSVGAWATDGIVASSNTTNLEHVYLIHRATTNTDQYWGCLGENVTNATSGAAFAFIESGTADAYFIYCVNTGKYLSCKYSDLTKNGKNKVIGVSDQDSATKWKIATATRSSVSCYEFQPYNSSNGVVGKYANWYAGTSDNISMGLWQNAASGDDGSAWAINELENPVFVECTYKVQLNGNEIGQKVIKERVGAAPTKSFVPSYVTSEGFPTSISAEGTHVYTINTTYGSNMPFAVNGVYRIDLAGGTYYLFANNNRTYCQEKKDGFPTALNNDYLWRVGGDWFNGFTFQNLSGYYIGVTGTNPANSTDTKVSTNPSGETNYCYHFEMLTNGSNSSYRFRPYGGSNFLGHTSVTDLHLQFYNYYDRDASYNSGNQLRFTECTDYTASLQNKVDDILSHKGHIGYPKSMISLEAYASNPVSAANSGLVLDALTAIYTDTDIVLPEDGKAYRIAVNGATGNKWYLPISGAPVTNVASAATFVCGKSNNKCLFVLANDSKYLTYNGVRDGVYDSRWNSFTVSSLSAKSSTGFNNTYPAAARFGYVFIESSGRDAGQPSKEGCLVVKEDGTWSAADDPFFNGNHTSAITFEEVEFPYTTANLQYDKDRTEGPTYSTIYLPFAMTIPAGVKAYGVTGNEDSRMILNKVADGEQDTNLPKGGYILYSESVNGPVSIAPAAANPESADNLLTGSVDPNASLPLGTIWVLGKKSGIGFYQYTGQTYPLGKALYVGANTGTSKFSLSFNDVVTDIKNLENANRKSANIYNLQGVRLNHIQKGLNIVDGKKVIR